MAIVRKSGTVAMLLTFENGVNNAGKTIYKTITLSKVNPELTDENFYNAGEVLAGLQKLTLSDIKHRKIESLVSQ